MKITYTGKPEALTSAEATKIEAKFAKLAKLLDAQKGEAEARVILSVASAGAAEHLLACRYT